MLGLGAVVVGALAGCGSAATTASTSATTISTAPASTTEPSESQPAQTPSATAQPTSTAAPEPTTQPTTEPTVEPTAEPTATAIPPTATPASTGHFKDGEYVGDAVRADRWGNMQVRAVVQGGELVQIEILDYPSSTSRSDLISRAALPTLISEAIENQTAQVDIVTRATDTSVAFIASLESALADAAIGATV
jgi:uncharacterized protein with FMN-binding domain